MQKIAIIWQRKKVKNVNLKCLFIIYLKKKI